MSVQLILSSDNASVKRSNADFDVNFSRPIVLPDLAYTVKCTKVSSWYSVPNLTAGVHISFTYDASDYNITFPKGIYDVDGIQQICSDYFVDSVDESVIPFTLLYNSNTAKLTVDIHASTTALTLSDEMAGILGWTQTGSPVSLIDNAIGQRAIDLTNGVTSWVLSANLTNASFINATSSSALVAFTPRVPPYSSVDYEPLHPAKLQVNQNIIRTITVTLTDQTGTILDLNDESLVCNLVLEPM